MPESWRERAFERESNLYRLRAAFREGIEFRREDIRRFMPAGPFHLILCRNLVFTYFDTALQRQVLESLAQRLVARGALMLGVRR